MKPTHWIVATIFAAAAVAGPSDATADESAVFKDNFDDKFQLEWNIIRPESDHYSLATSSGELVVTTHYGSIHGTTSPGDLAKNIMLVDKPIKSNTDFVATLTINEFTPATYYHQVALLVYQSDDDYLKWSMERSWQGTGVDNLVLVAETDGESEHFFPTVKTIDGPFWLRMQRTGNEYTAFYSNDGDNFEEIGSETWTPSNADEPVKAGFLAKNGGNASAGDIDVFIESFELQLNPK